MRSKGCPNKVMAAEYRTTLPDEELLASEIDRTREALDARGLLPGKKAKTGPTTQRGDVRKGKRKRSR